MSTAFEQIGEIDTLMAAALVSPLNQLLGWCANSAVAPEKLLTVADAIRSMLNSLRVDHSEARCGAVAFGEKTLVFRDYPTGLFIAWLDSPVNDEVLDWLWGKTDRLLENS